MRRVASRLTAFLLLPQILLAGLILATPALAQSRRSSPSKKSRAERALAARINEIISRDGARNALWGIEVYSPKRGRTVYSHNGDRYFTPASVTKLFTAAAALDLIGPEYRFRTTVETRGSIDEKGRLAGNIILVGRGDPDLAGCALPYVSPPPEPEKRTDEVEEAEEEEEEVCPFSQNLDRLAAEVAAHGVTLVTGDLIADTSFLSPEPYADGWAYHDVVWSYGAPVRALSIADSIIAYKVEPGARVGAKAKITWQPPTSIYSLRNMTWTAPAGARTQLYLRRDPGTYEVEISGPVALRRRPRTLAVAVEEPAEVAAELFRESLLKAGVRVQGAIRIRFGAAPPMPSPSEEDPGQVLAEHLSLPLAEEVRFILKVSQNMHTEVLLRLLGRSDPPETAEPVARPRRSRNAPPPRYADGSTEAGLNVLRAWLHGAGIDPFDAALRDGSGLSLKGMVKPKAVIALLQHAATRPWADLYFDSLPVAGQDGTLRRRMRGRSPAAGRVHAKTGTLTGNIALAGFVDTAAGERLYFAVFLNHHVLPNGRATGLIDDIMIALVDFPRARGK